MAKSTVKVPGKKKAGGGTITIPGTKIKAPRSLVILAGGGVLAALFFMRGSEDDEEGGGVSGSILAEEIAQRFASERDAFSGAIEDINQRLFDIEQERLEGGILPEPDQPRPRRDRIPDAPSGTFEQPTTTLFPFVQLSEVEAPRDEISITTSDAQIRADLRRGAAYAERAEAFVRRGSSTTATRAPAYQERTVAQLIAGARKPVDRPGVSAAQKRADLRRGTAFAERQAAFSSRTERATSTTPEPELHPMRFRAGGSLAAEAREKADRDAKFFDNLPSWY